MRLPFLLLVIALLAAMAPAAPAQTATPALLLRIVTPTDAIDAGNSTSLTLEVTRSCANPLVLDPQVVHVAFAGGIDRESGAPGNATWSITGPLQGMFQQQLCATQSQQTIVLQYQATPAADAQAGQHPFTVRVGAEQASPTTPAIPEVPQNFILNVAEKPATPVVEEAPERESPGLGGIGALVALAATAFVARRRH